MGENMLLEMRNITKRFPGVKAVDNVSFQLKAGEVHALLGENGAGKSTLIKILGGIYFPDDGEIFIDGQQTVIDCVATAQKNHISIIHQEIIAEPFMTVAENIFLGRELRTKTGLVDRKAMVRETNKLMKSMGIAIDGETVMGSLSLGMQQLVEIVRSVSTDAKIIVMDEPTSSLSEDEISKLFVVIRQLQKDGCGIIYISHKLEELFQISQRITVLRDGQYIDTVDTNQISSDNLIRMMVGRELEKYYILTDHTPGETALEVSGLTYSKYFHDISFKARYGEVVGFYGLVGAGRSEVMKTIFGIYPKEAGVVKIDGKEVHIADTTQAIKSGVAYISENRKTEELVLVNDVGFNITLVSLKQFVNGIHINREKRKNVINKFVDLLKIKITSESQIVNNLSGGNQQKVVLAKWLSNNSRILILDEPTRGIDVGAKSEIYGIINGLAEDGMSIIMVSSELPEIINMCDRIYVMQEGEMKGELSRDDFSQETIMQFAAGGRENE